MKNFSIFAALAALVLALPSCGDSNATDKLAEGAGALAGVDLEDMGAVKAKGSELLGDLTSSLKGITDEKSATSAATNIGAMLPALTKIKDVMGGDFMTGMKDKLSGVTGAITGLTTKFAGNEGMMKVLEPILSKVKGLIGM